MHQQHHGAICGAFVNVGNAQAPDFGVVRLVCKVGQVLKSVLRRAKKVLNVGVLAHFGVNFEMD
jgi:hypothetical protein